MLIVKDSRYCPERALQLIKIARTTLTSIESELAVWITRSLSTQPMPRHSPHLVRSNIGRIKREAVHITAGQSPRLG